MLFLVLVLGAPQGTKPSPVDRDTVSVAQGEEDVGLRGRGDISRWLEGPDNEASALQAGATIDSPTSAARFESGSVVIVQGTVPAHLPDAVTVELTIKSSGPAEVWNFDVPPTPHTSLARYLLCSGGEGCVGDGKTTKSPASNATRCFGSRCRMRYARAIPDLADGAHELTVRMFLNAAEYTSGNRPVVGRSASSVIAVGPAASAGELLERIEAKRRSGNADAAEREANVSRCSGAYTLTNPDLQRFSDEFVDARLLQAIETGPAAVVALAKPLRGAAGVYVIPVYSALFRELLLSELKAARAASDTIMWTQPNTYGLSPLNQHTLYTTHTAAACQVLLGPHFSHRAAPPG